MGVNLKDPKVLGDAQGLQKSAYHSKKKVKISATAIVMWTVLSHFDNLQVLQSRPPRSPLHALQKLFFFGDMFPYNSNSETHEKNEIENEKKHHATAVPLPRRI